MKKKIKIISEKVNAQFVEIKKEKSNIEQEETLDDKFDNQDEQFSDFSSSGNRTAPVLTAENSTQNIEQSLANVPSNNTNTNPDDQAKVYNAPDYGPEKKYEDSSQTTRIRPINPAMGFGNAGTELIQPQQTTAPDPRTQNLVQQDQNYQTRVRPQVEEERRMPFRRTEKRRFNI